MLRWVADLVLYLVKLGLLYIILMVLYVATIHEGGVTGRVVLAAIVGATLVGAGVWSRYKSPSSGSATLSPALADVANGAGIALLTGGVLGLVVLPIEDDRLHRELRRDNVQFVRETVIGANDGMKPFAGLDLRGAQLTGLDLSYADLAGSDLRDADFEGTNLEGANLENVDLSSANLSGADLRMSDISGATLNRTLLVQADLSCSDMREVSASGAYFRDANLAGVNLLRAEITQSGFEGANLSSAHLTSSVLEDSDFAGAILENAHLRWASLSGSDLSTAELHNVWWYRHTTWPDDFDPPPRHMSPPGEDLFGDCPIEAVWRGGPGLGG